MKEYKLSKLIELEPYMKILIDDEVDVDENGNYLVNVGYTRVSTDRQAEQGFGLDIQERDILTYAKRNDIKNLILFIDDGYTGTNMERPALQGIISMITHYNNGQSRIRINSMIIPRIDRLGRTLLGTLQFIQDYIVAKSDSKNSSINQNKEDINFISVSENYCRIERSNPQGKFLLMLFASLAEFDRDMIVEKLKNGRIARVASGKWMGGGIVPYGYRYDKEQGKLIIIPEQADKVKEIFRLYIEEKMSPLKISERLGFKGDRIITQILQRKSLTGCIIYKGVEYPGEHEPIISLRRWEEAQDEMESRSIVKTSTSYYLLSGLMVCGECGAKMRYQQWNKQTKECKIVCYSHHKTKKYLVKDENCPNKLYWAEDIESAVIEELFRLTYLSDDSDKKSKSFVDPIETLTTQLTVQKRRLSRLYDFDDDEDDDVLKDKILNCKRKINELQFQLQEEQSKKVLERKIGKAKKTLKTLKDAWFNMTQQEKQIVVRELIDRVTIYQNGTVDVHLKLSSYLAKK